MFWFYFSVISVITVTEGKLNRNFGPTWNRYYPVVYNGTVVDYVRTLAKATGDFADKNGLSIRPLDYSLSMDETLLGVTLKGNIEFTNGIITNSGRIVPSVYAPESNRSSDLKTAFILFAVRLDQLSVTYQLQTKLEQNNTEGTVEINLKNLDFFFEMTHTFATNTNQVELSSFVGEIDWKIKPRSVVPYAIETVVKRRNDTKEWYKDFLIAWQRDTLGPMLVQQAQDLAFPISPN